MTARFARHPIVVTPRCTMNFGLGSAVCLLVLGCTSAQPPVPDDQPTLVEEPQPASVPEPVVPTEVVEESTVSEGAPAPPPGPVGKSFTVVARLMDAGRWMGPCGVFHWVVVMKFAVVHVVDGRFESETIYAAVSCPEMPPTRASDFASFVWKVGDTYRLRLRTAGHRRGGVLVDAFDGEPGVRHDLLGIDRA